MKKLVAWAPAVPALIFLCLAVGCSKAPDSKPAADARSNPTPNVGAANGPQADLPKSAGPQGDAGSNPPALNGSELVGQYAMQIAMPPMNPNDPNAQKVEDMVKKRLSGYGLELKSDGRFLITGEQEIEGTWEAGSGTVTLKPDKVGGKSLAEANKDAHAKSGTDDSGTSDKPQTLTVEDGGKTLRPVMEKGSKHREFWFTRK
jgi:hypothetical protein